MMALSKKSISFMLGLMILLLVLAALQWALTGMPATGDEPEYIYRAFSFARQGNFHAPMAAFAQAMPRFAPMVAGGLGVIQGHPAFMSVLGAPLVAWFGVDGARALSTLFGLVAAASMACLLRPVVGGAHALLVAAFIALTLPVLPYTHLFYTDIMAMALVSASWMLARAAAAAPTDRRGLAMGLGAVVLAVMLPFVHIRVSPLAAVLGLIALWTLGRTRGMRGLAMGIGVCGVAGVAFVFHQFLLFGRLVDGGSATFQPSLAGVAIRTAVQLAEFRHGLVPANPGLLLAFAGLAIGVWRRSNLALQACALLLAYVPVIIWGTASESWPARFWVPVMPALAAGFAIWMESARGLPARLGGAVLIAASFCNSLILLRTNGAFLENRTASLTYDSLFPFHDRFDIAGLLPWDSFDFSVFGFDAAPALDGWLLLRASVVILAIVAAYAIDALAPATHRPRIASWLPLLALAPLAAGLMRPLPSRDLTVEREPDAVVLRFSCPVPARLVRVLTPMRPAMAVPAFPAGLDLMADRNGRGLHPLRHAPFAPVIALPGGTYRAIRLAASGPGAGGDWRNAEFEVMTAGIRRTRCGQ